ncbi:hypothetical protein D3C87_1663440 [compost metagenome]
MGVIAGDQRPPRVLGKVRLRAVHEVAMEKQCVPRLQFTINQLHGFQCMVYHFHVGTYLLAREAMIDPAHFVRAFDHLQAAVLFVSGRQCDHYAHQLVRINKLVFIPIPIILMPFPGTSYFRLFLHEFGMKMAYLTFLLQKLPD